MARSVSAASRSATSSRGAAARSASLTSRMASGSTAPPFGTRHATAPMASSCRSNGATCAGGWRRRSAPGPRSGSALVVSRSAPEATLARVASAGQQLPQGASVRQPRNTDHPHAGWLRRGHVRLRPRDPLHLVGQAHPHALHRLDGEPLLHLCEVVQHRPAADTVEQRHQVGADAGLLRGGSVDVGGVRPRPRRRRRH